MTNALQIEIVDNPSEAPNYNRDELETRAAPNSKKQWNVISLGGGVQSSTMALMASCGELGPMPDCAVFADTQDEPESVYRWLDWLEPKLAFPVHRVTRGDCRIPFCKCEQRRMEENSARLHCRCTLAESMVRRG